jgi:hypothetical protein
VVERPRGLPSVAANGLPITIGSLYYAGIKIHETRIIRLFEVLLHGGNSLGGWTARYIYQVVLECFQLSQKAYGLNQLRYDLRKLKGHGLLQRDGSRYANGAKVRKILGYFGRGRFKLNMGIFGETGT